VLNYRSYPKHKVGIRYFWTTLYIVLQLVPQYRPRDQIVNSFYSGATI